jgi:ribosomal protein S18 acetylase RimI-like enzyme
MRAAGEFADTAHRVLLAPGQAIIAAVGLTARPVVDAEDVEMLRFIRNEQRQGFAHDTAPISTAAQTAWWGLMEGKVIAYLYQQSQTFVVGYGLLRLDEDGRWWSSVAVLPEFGGRGYGKAVTSHIIRQSPTGVVYAQARKDNPQADRIHDRRDWEVTGEDKRLWHYRTREGL